MSDVPKFVRQRLAQQAPGEHPEANLLAAFAEGGLTRRERDQVLAHLSQCAACREAVALATPEMPAAPAATGSQAQWARWPVLRWAGLAAAVVVVAAAVVVQNAWRSEPAQKTAVSQSAPSAPQEAKEAETAVAENKAAPVLHDRVATKKAAADQDARAKRESRRDQKEVAGPVANAAPKPLHGNTISQNRQLARVEPSTGKFETKVAPAEQQQIPGKAGVAGGAVGGAVAMDSAKELPAAPPAAPVAASNESVEVAAQADAMSAKKSRMNVQQRAMPERPSSDAAPAPSTATSSVVMMKRAVIAPTRWRVSSEGALEHSIDAGRSWQLVRIASPQTTFRAFCSVGSDLWAGGNGGALYHSPDDGRTWARVTAKAGDAVLDADIVRIEFTDAQHGSATTTAGETWTTTDGGATWSVARR